MAPKTTFKSQMIQTTQNSIQNRKLSVEATPTNVAQRTQKSTGATTYCPVMQGQYSISAVAAYIFLTFLTSLSLFNQLMHRVDNTVEGKSSVFYLIRMRWMPSARGCR